MSETFNFLTKCAHTLTRVGTSFSKENVANTSSPFISENIVSDVTDKSLNYNLCKFSLLRFS